MNNNLPKRTGEPRKLETGAQRDNATGKGRCDLLPLKQVARVMEDDVLYELSLFMETKDDEHIVNALRKSTETIPALKDKGLAHMMLEVSLLYEAGAIAYGENNWKRGMPLKWYIDSGIRHYNKELRGDKDEPHPHYRGFIWNMLGALWTIDNFPESLDNLYVIE